MFIPKQYCLGLNFKCNWARYMFTCHIWRPCVHTPHTFLHGPSQAHAVHTDTLSTGRAACPAVEPGAARAQETSHPPLSPSTVGSPSASELRLHPGVWGCFLGPFPPQFLWEPAVAGGLVGEQRPGPWLPLGPAGRSPPVPGASLSPTASPLLAGRLVAFLRAGLFPPAPRLLISWFTAPDSTRGLQAGCSEVFIGISVKVGRGSFGPSGDALLGPALQTAPQTAPDGPQTGRARFPGESGFSGRGLCLAWQRLRPVSLLTSRACVACGWRGGG